MDDAGHWVKFVVVQTDGAAAGAAAWPQPFADAARPGRFEAGRLRQHAPRAGAAGPGRVEVRPAHQYPLGTIRCYDNEDAATLLEDVWKEVD